MKLSHYEWDPEQDLIAQGGFAEVFKAKDVNTANRWVALKIYKEAVSKGTAGSTGQKKYSLEQEFSKIDGLSHTNIISFYGLEYLQHEDMMGRVSNYPILIMEYAGEGTLKDLMQKKFPSDEVARIMKCVVSAVEYLHEQGIIHRDLKPGNILFSKDRNGKLIPKVTDFGISRDVLSDKTIEQSFTEGVGTSHYMAPEQFFKKKFGLNGEISERTDIWAIGVILYRMFTGKFPFGDGKKDYELIRDEIVNETPDFSVVSEDFKAIIQGCLQKDASKRIGSASELMKMFSSNMQLEFDEEATVFPVEKAPSGNIIKTPDTKRKKTKPIVIIAGVLLLIALGVSGFMINKSAKVKGILAGAWDHYKIGEYEDAYEEYLRASEYGSGKAYYYLALMNQAGRGVKIDYEKSKEYVNDAVDKGYDMAAFHMGTSYLNGWGVPVDTTEAIQHFEKSFKQIKSLADEEDPEAMNLLGILHLRGYGADKDLKKSFELTKKAAEKKHPISMYNLGNKYLYGTGTDKDCAKAKEWHEKGTEINSYRSWEGLGRVYYYGCDDIAIDYEKAFTNYQKAADLNNLEAKYKLGVMHHYGRGVPKDIDKALVWYTKAAEEDHIEAMNSLGVIYYDKEKYKEAKIWYIKAAEKNNYYGQYNLGQLYYYGRLKEGIDYEKALEWYLKSAEQGYTNAQLQTGFIYGNHKKPVDNEKAVYWYEKAAEKGNAVGQFNVGVMYQNGKGYPKDENKAAEWYEKSANQNYANAQYQLGLISYRSKSYNQAQGWFQKAGKQGHTNSLNYLGILYDQGLVGSISYSKAYGYFKKSADLGNNVAQYNVGLYHYYGKGRGKSKSIAKRWYNKSCNNGYKEACAKIKELF